VHGIFEGRGDIIVAILADAATTFIGRIFDEILVGLFLVKNVCAFVASDAANFAMVRFDKFHGNAEGVPAPHLRGGNASTGDTGGRAGRRGTEFVHFPKVSVTPDARTAGVCLFLGGKRSSNAERTRQP